MTLAVGLVQQAVGAGSKAAGTGGRVDPVQLIRPALLGGTVVLGRLVVAVLVKGHAHVGRVNRIGPSPPGDRARRKGGGLLHLAIRVGLWNGVEWHISLPGTGASSTMVAAAGLWATRQWFRSETLVTVWLVFCRLTNMALGGWLQVDALARLLAAVALYMCGSRLAH